MCPPAFFRDDFPFLFPFIFYTFPDLPGWGSGRTGVWFSVLSYLWAFTG